MIDDEMSMMDAFHALNEVSDDDETLPRLRETAKVRKSLTEGKSFPVSDSKAMEAARQFNAQNDDDITLEVIDADADTVEHLKDKKDYLGQAILTCKKCQAKQFIDTDKLVPSDDDPDIYNVDTTCPYCKSVGVGFSLLGQVGKFEDEEAKEVTTEEEPKEAVPADETNPLPASTETTDTDTALFDNTEEPEAEEATSAEETEEGNNEEATAEEEEDEEEKDAMETETSEDDDKVEKKESFERTMFETNSEDDDTEENYFKDFDEIPESGIKEEPEEKEVEEKPKKKLKLRFMHESLKGFVTVAKLLDRFADVDYLRNIVVTNTKGEKLFNGSYKDLPVAIQRSELVAFNSEDSMLVLNADSDLDAYIDGFETIGDVLDLFDGDNDAQLTVFVDDEDAFTGNKEEVLDYYESYPLVSMEAPEVLDIVINNNDLHADIEEDKNIDDLDSLTESILLKNHLSPRKASNSNCNEYWIKESLANGEDNELIFNKYVKGTGLEEDFKRITGYEEKLTESKTYDKDVKALTECFINRGIYRGDESCFDDATKAIICLIDNEHKDPYSIFADKAVDRITVDDLRTLLAGNDDNKVIIAAVGNDLADLADNYECCDVEGEDFYDLADTTACGKLCNKLKALDIIPADSNCNDVCKFIALHALSDLSDGIGFDEIVNMFKKDSFVKFVADNKKCDTYGTEACFDKADDVPETTSFKDRKELSKFVEDLRNNNRPYTINRSLKEGYRYDVIVESKKDVAAWQFTMADGYIGTIAAADMNEHDARELADSKARENGTRVVKVTTLTQKELDAEIDKASRVEWEVFYMRSYVGAGWGHTKEEGLKDFLVTYPGYKKYYSADPDNFDVVEYECRTKDDSIDEDVNSDKSKFDIELYTDPDDKEWYHLNLTFNGTTVKMWEFGNDGSRDIELNKAFDCFEKELVSHRLTLPEYSRNDIFKRICHAIRYHDFDDDGVCLSDDFNDLFAEALRTLNEDTHAKYAKPEGDRVKAFNNALTYAKKYDKPFIYGYTAKTGKEGIKFFALETPIKVTGRPADAEKDFRNKYKNCVDVEVVYPNKSPIKEDRYDLTAPENELINDVEVENPNNVDSTELVDTKMSEEEIEVLRSIGRIAKDTCDAIEKYYGIKTDPRLVVADIIQDLRLVSGAIKPEDLPDTPINNLTKQMYKDYNTTYEVVDGLMSAISGEHFETTPDRKLKQAIQMLNSPAMTKEAIDQKIGSPMFLRAARRGMIPYVANAGLLHEAYLGMDTNDDPDEVEYMENALDYCEEISKMDRASLENVEHEYGFDHSYPEDDAERMIFDAITKREVELDDLEAMAKDALDDADDYYNNLDADIDNRLHEDLESYHIIDRNESTGEEASSDFKSEETANDAFDALKDTYAGDNTHTIIMTNGKDDKPVRKWNAEEGVNPEAKDPTLTEEAEVIPVPAEQEVEEDCTTTTARNVMAAYQNANKWLDTIKEVIYTEINCPFFSSYIHTLAHTMPERFDKFGDILHTCNIEIPYPTTVELETKPANLTEAIDATFKTLDMIKDALNAFIKCTDDDNHGMSCAAEALLNDIESEYPMLFRIQAKAAECKDDTVSFDKFVGQYVDHKDSLLEDLDNKAICPKCGKTLSECTCNKEVNEVFPSKPSTKSWPTYVTKLAKQLVDKGIFKGDERYFNQAAYAIYWDFTDRQEWPDSSWKDKTTDDIDYDIVDDIMTAGRKAMYKFDIALAIGDKAKDTIESYYETFAPEVEGSGYRYVESLTNESNKEPGYYGEPIFEILDQLNGDQIIAFFDKHHYLGDEDAVNKLAGYGVRGIYDAIDRYLDTHSGDSLLNDLENAFSTVITEAKKDEIEEKKDPVMDAIETIEAHTDLVQDQIDTVNHTADAIETINASEVANKDEIVNKLEEIKADEQKNLDALEEVSELLPKVGDEAKTEEPAKEETPAEEVEEPKEETIPGVEEDFDDEAFDKDINEYLEKNFNETYIYSTINGSKDVNGNIMLEGLVKSEKEDINVKFLLTPSKSLTEGMEGHKTYTVYSSWIDKKFEYSI